MRGLRRLLAHPGDHFSGLGRGVPSFHDGARHLVDAEAILPTMPRRADGRTAIAARSGAKNLPPIHQMVDADAHAAAVLEAAPAAIGVRFGWHPRAVSRFTFAEPGPGIRCIG